MLSCVGLWDSKERFDFRTAEVASGGPVAGPSLALLWSSVWLLAQWQRALGIGSCQRLEGS